MSREKPRKMNKPPLKKRINGTIITVVGIIVAALFLAPMFWVILSSFKTKTEAVQTPLIPWPTQGVSLDTYRELNTFGAGLYQHFVNSVTVYNRNRCPDNYIEFSCRIWLFQVSLSRKECLFYNYYAYYDDTVSICFDAIVLDFNQDESTEYLAGTDFGIYYFATAILCFL